MRCAISAKFKRKNAKRRTMIGFTLAEVLLTLGVIGVIAAFTIPNLIGSYQKQATVTKLQKVYSSLQQAVKLSEVDNGPVSNWNFALSSTDFLNTYFVPYLSVIKNCGTTEGGCWANDLNVRTKKDGSVYESVSSWPRLLLKDGTFLALANQGFHAHLDVDIDGVRGKSIYGKDVFVFTLTPIAFSDGHHNVSAPGLYLYGQGLSRSSLLSSCNGGMSQNCSALIQMDGWKISDDYDW